MGDIVRAIEVGIAEVDLLPVGELGMPVKLCRGRKAEIAFHLVRMNGKPKPGDRIVGSGPGIGGLLNSAARVRQTLDGKDSKYELQDAPYAIVLGIRDHMCDLDDVLEALVGTSAVVVSTGVGTRKGDGYFGQKRRGARDGKHTRVSSVFTLEDWWPGGSYKPRVVRFDNPFAASTFPIDAVPFDAHWGTVEQGSQHIRADWLVWPRPQVLI